MEDLLPLLAVAAYWLFRAATRKKKKTRAGSGKPVVTGSKAPTPFEQLMAQLEEALDEPKEVARVEAESQEVEPPRPVERQAERPPAPRAAPRPPRAVPISFDAAADPIGHYEGFGHEEHGFGKDNPLSEEVFESRPRFAPRPTAQPKIFDPHGLKKPTSAPAPRRRAVSWAERLHDPAAAREALVLKTIFEGPWRPRKGRIQ